MSTSSSSAPKYVNDNPIFPAEIFQLIINEVASLYPSKRSLKNCCLVCKNFVPICRPHLFRCVEFGPYGYSKRSRHRLLQVILNNSNISKHIKEVVVRIDKKQTKSTVWRGYSGWSAPVNTTISRRELRHKSDEYSLSLHEFLPSLETLHIKHTVEGHSEPCENIKCQELGRNVLEELTWFGLEDTVTNLKLTGLAIYTHAIFAITGLRSLETRSCRWLGPWNSFTDIESSLPSLLPLSNLCCTDDRDFPYRILEYCPELKTLDLGSDKTHFGIDDEDPLELFANYEDVFVYPKLQRVAITEPLILEYLSSSTIETHAFPALKNLRLAISQYTEENEGVYQILRHAPSVEALEINFMGIPPDSDDVQFSALDLGRCLHSCKATLTELEIGFTTDNFGIEGQSGAYSIQTICNGLTAIQGDNIIEILILAIDEHTAGAIQQTNEEKMAGWGRLDSILSSQGSVGGFPRLGAFFMVVTQADTDDAPVDGSLWRDKFWPQVLPKLHSMAGIMRGYKENENMIICSLRWVIG